MHRVLAVAALVLTAASAQALSGWSEKGDTGSQILVDVSAPDARNVFVIGFEFGGGALPTPVARVFASADGGGQFTDISGPVAQGGGFAMARAVFFVDSQVGWAAVGSKLWRTVDRGTTWTSSDVGFDVGAIHFFDARRGLVAGADGQVKGTSDGGASWAAVSTPAGPMLRTLHFVDDTHGWAAGHAEDDAALPDDATVFITSDGGRTWSKGATLPANQGIAAVEFLCDGKTGWVAAFEHASEDEWKAVLYRTTDGGLTLQNVELPLQVGTLSGFGNAPIRTGLPLALHFADASRGRLVAAAFLMKSSSGGSGGSSSSGAVWRVVDYVTEDGGASWAKTDLGTVTMSFPNLPPSDGNFLAGFMRDLHGGWIVGDEGRVWASEVRCANDDACPAEATCSEVCVGATPDCAVECPAGKQLVDGECVAETPQSPDGGELPDSGEPNDPEETAPAGCECGVASGAGWAILLLLAMRARSRR